MNKLPAPLQHLVSHFSRLPGLGPKSALRCALALLKWPEHEALAFGQGLCRLHSELAICERCGSLAAASPCHICSDPARARDILCLVSEWDSLLVMEEGGFYKGQYMVLGGLISPLDNVHPEALDLDLLRKRLFEREVREVVLALGATVEVPTIDGKAKLKIEPGTQPGKVLRLRNKGLPSINSYGTGDLLVNVSVYIPETLSSTEKETLNGLENSPNFQPNKTMKEKIFSKFKHFFD